MKMMKAANLTEETFRSLFPRGTKHTIRNSWRQAQVPNARHPAFGTRVLNPSGSLLPLSFLRRGASSRDGFQVASSLLTVSLCGLFSAASWISVSNPDLQITWLRSVFVVFLWNWRSCTPFTESSQPRDWKLVFKTKCRTGRLPGVSTQLLSGQMQIRRAFVLYFFNLAEMFLDADRAVMSLRPQSSQLRKQTWKKPGSRICVRCIQTGLWGFIFIILGLWCGPFFKSLYWIHWKNIALFLLF